MRSPIGCAIWSLAMADTVRSLESAAGLGFECVQFGFLQASDLEPGGVDRIAEALRRTGLTVAAGMVSFSGEDYTTLDSIRRTAGFVPAKRFPERLARCRAVAEALARLGIGQVTVHAGFIPEAGDPSYGAVAERVGAAVDAFRAAGIGVGLETGQESAEALQRFLADLGREDVGINLDPANFVLYGSDDPVSAAEALAARVTLVHVKDAVASDRPGEVWGTEVALGQGEVDWPVVLRVLADAGYTGSLIVEREGGTDRAGDLVAARRRLERLWV